MKNIFLLIWLFTTTHGALAQPLSVYGIKIKVPDLSKAKDFYCGILLFEIESEIPSRKLVKLKTNSFTLLLQESNQAQYIEEKGLGHTSLSLQVNNLDSSISYLRAKKVSFIRDVKRTEGIGHSIYILDPFGNSISLDQVSYSTKKVQEPFLYNCGIYVPDIDKALFSYTLLGFISGTRKYMPDDMPMLNSDKTFAFMLHKTRSDMPSVKKNNIFLVFRADSDKKLDEISRSVRLTRFTDYAIIKDATNVETEIIIDK